ncbi:phosphodiesterase [Nocardia sp. NPDC050793]|uniref:phosphodiesterase n=1 Tax=Nocardia sp. NPDC050793 TaxID=3155159 RepID=UPI003400D87D
MTDLAAGAVRGVFSQVARLRHARVFHPNGLRLSGRLHAEPEYEWLFGAGERAALARLSKGIGTPAGLPDVLGLALRVLDRDEHPWDFALATTGRGSLGRFVFTPARSWRTARYGCLMPYRLGDSAPTWIFAEPDDRQPGTPSLDAMADHLRDEPATFVLWASAIGAPERKLAEVVLHPADPGDYRTDFFDPMTDHPDEVRILPEVIGRVRELAYVGSRSGRGEQP